MRGDARARKLAHGVLTEFVEAAEPKRQRKVKWQWWWNPAEDPPRRYMPPTRFRSHHNSYWPTSLYDEPAPPPEPVAVVVLPPYGARINSPGGDAE